MLFLAILCFNKNVYAWISHKKAEKYYDENVLFKIQENDFS